MISNYLNSLCKNEQEISDTSSVTSLSRKALALPPFEEHEENISYEIESLLLTFPVKKLISHKANVLQEIC